MTHSYLPLCRLGGAMHPVQEFAGRHHRKKELLLLPLRYMALQIKPPALGLDQDIGIN